jgi:hypothetical protein
MSQYIKTKEGMPELRDFASQTGTPIVIDVLTSIAYYLYKNTIYPLATGTPIYDRAFSNAFSDDFANG